MHTDCWCLLLPQTPMWETVKVMLSWPDSVKLRDASMCTQGLSCC